MCWRLKEEVTWGTSKLLVECITHRYRGLLKDQPFEAKDTYDVFVKILHKDSNIVSPSLPQKCQQTAQDLPELEMLIVCVTTMKDRRDNCNKQKYQKTIFLIDHKNV